LQSYSVFCYLLYTDIAPFVLSSILAFPLVPEDGGDGETDPVDAACCFFSFLCDTVYFTLQSRSSFHIAPKKKESTWYGKSRNVCETKLQVRKHGESGREAQQQGAHDATREGEYCRTRGMNPLNVIVDIE
jgi:hypothetical protein